MIDEYKKEFIDFGTCQLPHFRPENLDLYKDINLTKSLDLYVSKWIALNQLLSIKREEILSRPETTSVDLLTLETAFDRALLTIRQKFTTAYPLNL